MQGQMADGRLETEPEVGDRNQKPERNAEREGTVMYGYTVTVRYMDIKTGADRVSKVNFFSKWAARVKAKDWFNCYEVQSVEVIATDTGEVIYYHNSREEYDCEG